MPSGKELGITAGTHLLLHDSALQTYWSGMEKILGSLEVDVTNPPVTVFECVEVLPGKYDIKLRRPEIALLQHVRIRIANDLDLFSGILTDA